MRTTDMQYYGALLPTHSHFLNAEGKCYLPITCSFKGRSGDPSFDTNVIYSSCVCT